MARLDTHSSNYIGPLDVCCSVKALSVSESELFFRLSLTGVRSPAQTVSVTNTGKGRIQIKKVVVTHGSGDFYLVNANNYPDFLDAGEKFDIYVDFLPVVDGKFIGILEIYTDEDRLPYVIVLHSSIRVPDEDDGPNLSAILARIGAEERKRASEDIRVKAEVTSDYITKINAEVAARKLADATEALQRSQGDTLVRGFAQTLTNTEAQIRYDADTEILRRLGLIEDQYGSGTIIAVDEGARAMIRDEYIIRATADEAEAIARRTLTADFITAISEANAKIVEQSRVYTNAYEALAERTVTIEAAYQTSGDVNAIADAKIAIEQIARATAISAETRIREQQVATLTTNTGLGLDNERILREAAILNERLARVTLTDATAQNFESLTARMTGARGITPNGTFLDKAGWISSFDFVPAGSSKFIPTSKVGQYATLTSTDYYPVDTNRAYQITSSFTVFNSPSTNYVGVTCYDKNLGFIDNIYANNTVGQLQNGITTTNHILIGEEDYPTPAYSTRTKFPKGTAVIRLFILGNYPVGGSSVPSSYTTVDYLWLDDVTNTTNANARISLVERAVSTLDESTTLRIQDAQSDFAKTTARVSDLEGENGARIYEIIQATARIRTEEFTRADAIASEARRVDQLLADYNGQINGPGGTVDTKIRAAIETEQRARADAIQAEATRVNNLLANYATTGALSGVDARVSAEIRDRDIAISNAISAEVSRVSTLLANYATTGALNTAISAEVTNRDSAISSAVGSEATRVNNLLANYATTGALNSAISAEVTNRDSAITSAVGAEAGRVNTLLASYATTGALTSAITAEVTNRDSAIATAVSSEASRVNGLFAGYATNGALSAAISAEISSRDVAIASAVSAEASRLDTFRGVYNGFVASQEVINQTIAGANGRSYVYWAVIQNLGDKRGALELRTQDGVYTTFDITANVRIYGNLLVTGTVDTLQIADNACTNGIGGDFNNVLLDSETPGTQTKRSGMLTLPVTGKRTRVDFQCDIALQGGAVGPTLTVSLVRSMDGGATGVVLRTTIFPAGTLAQPFTFWKNDNPPQGDASYYIIASKNSSISNGRNFNITNIQFYIVEQKK